MSRKQEIHRNWIELPRLSMEQSPGGGGEGDENQQGHPAREQDRLLPVANIARCGTCALLFSSACLCLRVSPSLSLHFWHNWCMAFSSSSLNEG